MDAPADKTAKRISSEEWFARYDGKPRAGRGKSAPASAKPPADRIAVRA